MPMKLLQAIVVGTGFRDRAHNPMRLTVLDQLLNVATKQAADLLVLPGGYLAAGDAGELQNTIADVARRAAEAKVTVAFGVDLPDTPQGKSVRSPHLPYYG